MAHNRRTFLQLSASGIAAGACGGLSSLHAATVPPARSKSQTPPPPVTRDLARFLVNSRPDDVPPAVRKEATRTLLNWVGVTLGGCRHETTDIALAAMAPFSGPAQARVLGRSERLDALTASLINGIASHVLDFDDTHLKTIVHASSSVVPATLALAELRDDVDGKAFLHALVLGVETAFRTANAIYPDHYDVGWHITGTVGAIGTAVAAGKLLKLDERQMAWAIGLASSQSVGLRESFGSMNKSFNPGRAAQNGLMAALLAAKNFTSSDGMLEARRGWANTVSTKQDFAQITAGLGSHYETALNTYKPFACGIVIHPIIDGCIRLRNQHALKAEDIEKVELRVHPLVLELTGKKTPRSGLEAKFSVFHSAAVAIIEGRAGPAQYNDEAARRPEITALRDRVTASVDSKVHESQADISITLRDGIQRRVFVEHAIGSVENPMSDDSLTAKSRDLMQAHLSSEKVARLLDACWSIEKLPDAASLATLACP